MTLVRVEDLAGGYAPGADAVEGVSFALAATVTVFAGDQLGGIDLALPAITSTRRRAVAH